DLGGCVIEIDGHPAILGREPGYGQDPCGISPAKRRIRTSCLPVWPTKLGRVFTVFTIVLYATTGILTLWSIIETIRNRPAGKALLGGAALLLLLLIVQLIISIASFGATPAGDPQIRFCHIIYACWTLALAWSLYIARLL